MRPLTYTELSAPTQPTERPWVVLLHLGPIVFMVPCERPNETDETWPCNDCGVSIPKGDELCRRCIERQDYERRMEEAHPEWRCPPRE